MDALERKVVPSLNIIATNFGDDEEILQGVVKILFGMSEAFFEYRDR